MDIVEQLKDARDRVVDRLMHGKGGALISIPANPDRDIDCLLSIAAYEIESLRADNERLREALERIAKYGEDHIGYVNAEIDRMPISRFARAALAKADS